MYALRVFGYLFPLSLCYTYLSFLLVACRAGHHTTALGNESRARTDLSCSIPSELVREPRVEMGVCVFFFFFCSLFALGGLIDESQA